MNVRSEGRVEKSRAGNTEKESGDAGCDVRPIVVNGVARLSARDKGRP